MNHPFSVKRIFAVAFLLGAGLFFHPASATCTFTGASADQLVVTFTLPSIIRLDPDTPVGTVVYEDSAESSEITIHCTDEDEWVRKGYLSLTDADAREDVLPGVYKTNVAGIGIRAAASTERFPSYTEDDIVRPWKNIGKRHGFSDSTSVYRASAQLVVIGDIEDGDLDTSRLTSEEALGEVTVGGMRFSPASVRITTNTCNLVDKNIYVPLKTMNAGDFDGQYSEVLTDSNFKIEITQCAAGTKVDYQFTSAGSTGVTDGNILEIATGDSAARGVGIQILDKNGTVLNFDQDYTAISSTSAKESIDIPLKARYIKTGEIRAGKVDSVATFEVFYR